MPRCAVALLLPVLALGVAFASGCEGLPGTGSGATAADTTRAPGVPPPGEGLVTTATGQSVSATAEQLKRAITSSGATLVTEVTPAATTDSLRPMRLFIFGNPALGTPLMRSVQTAGIDLPQKMLVWQSASGDSTRITYNAPAYLATRHDLSGVSASLGNMGRALAALAEQAAGHAPDTSAFNADSIDAGAGLRVETSDFDARETFRRLKSAVERRPQLSVVASVNHAQNARDQNARDQNARDQNARDQNARPDSLRPTHLLIFDDAEAGTSLMQKAPTLGIDLPQKVLVWEEEEGHTFVAYNKPAYLARRHTLADTTGLRRIAETLQALAFEATADQEEVNEREEARRKSGDDVTF